MKNIIELKDVIINVKYIVSYSDYEIITVNKAYKVELTKDEITRIIFCKKERVSDLVNLNF